jgi:hypothetical protein
MIASELFDFKTKKELGMTYFHLTHINEQAKKSIDLKFLANFSKRIAILRKCFK